jgi:GntR family transcriptional repressor for pyruvate dehydrogenase complex
MVAAFSLAPEPRTDHETDNREPCSATTMMIRHRSPKMNELTVSEVRGQRAFDATFAEPVQSIRTFEAAIENIIAGVERSRLRRGDRLPNEGELAQQLRISKPTLRQALRVLERSGLLEVKAGKTGGIFLTSDYLPTEEISTQVASEEHSVLETLRARRLIESSVAHEASRVATASDIGEIERTVELLQGEGIDRAQIMRADVMFHRAVARATHNLVLEDAVKVVFRHLAPIRDLHREGGADAEVAYGLHQEQLDAMVARDADALNKALNTHFRFYEDRVAVSLGSTWEELFSVPA